MSVFRLGEFEKFSGNTAGVAKDYLAHYGSEDETKKRNQLSEKSAPKSFVDQYYNLATDFYEYGWGDSFHFACLREDETWEASMRRHEYYLALRMFLKPGDHVADIGCGVGGPARSISRFANCKVTGVTINAYQVERARRINQEKKCDHICNIIQGDFMALPFSENSMDGVYAVESTCHTTDKVGVFGEAFRVLKPGAYFAGYEWCVTDLYDPKNEEHVKVRQGIERGNGLPETVHYSVVKDALVQCGFELVDAFDAMVDNEKPWWYPFLNTYTLKGLARTKVGRAMSTFLISVLEKVGLLPAGCLEVQNCLNYGADCLVRGGETGIYTVGYFFLARKPLTKA